MEIINEKQIPNISAKVVKQFLEKKGYKINFDFRNAKLGNYIKGNHYPLPVKHYHVLIACCSKNNSRWICIADDTIPQYTCYILECEPRANSVTLWNLMELYQ